MSEALLGCEPVTHHLTHLVFIMCCAGHWLSPDGICLSYTPKDLRYKLGFSFHSGPGIQKQNKTEAGA